MVEFILNIFCVILAFLVIDPFIYLFYSIFKSFKNNQDDKKR